MSAPLTDTREKKRRLLKTIVLVALEILCLKKQSLDSMDFRQLSQIHRNLNELYNRGKSDFDGTNKIVSID